MCLTMLSTLFTPSCWSCGGVLDRQEWDSILSRLPLSPTDPWTSLLLTGTLSIIEPEEAYNRHAGSGGNVALLNVKGFQK